MINSTFIMRFSALFLCGGLILAATGCTAKAKLERHVKRADAYFAKRQFNEAQIEYLNAFRLNQNDAHIAQRLGDSFLESGDLQRGFQLLLHARELQPTNTAVRVKLASLFLMGGDSAKARQEANEVLKLEPLHSEAWVLLANSATNTNDVVEIRQRVNTQLASTPESPFLHLAAGVLAQKIGDLKGAEAAFSKAVGYDAKSSKANLALANVCLMQGNTNKAELHFRAASETAPFKSVERLSYSEFLIKTGRADEAKKFLEQTTSQAPDFVAAWNMLTQIAFSDSDTNSASQFISKALARDSDNRDALLNRARLQLAMRDFKTALAGLEKMADAFPRDSQVHHQLALAQLASDDAIRALGTLDKAVNLNTNNLDAVLLRAQVRISRGDLNSAIPELVRITRRAPKVPQPHYLLAGAYRQRGAVVDAVNVYSNMTKLFPSDPQPYQMIAGIQRQQTNLVAARQNYEAALKVNPNYLAAIDDLIELDILAKKYQDALARVQTYIEKYPDKPMPRLLEAKVLFAENKNDEAETAVKKAIELDPEFYPAHRALADFYIRTKQIEPAIQKLESMVAKNGKDAASLLQVGMLYESKADYKKARTAYESLLKVNPSSVPALNNLAYMLSEHMGDTVTAYQYARRARDLAPYDPFTADTFGWIILNRGEHAAALVAIQQANERLPNQPEVLYHLGMAHYHLGAVAPASDALERAISSPSEFKGKDKAREALALLKLNPAQATSQSIARLDQAVKRNASDSFAWTRLAQVYEARSQWDKARESYENALKVNSRSTLLMSRLAWLYARPLKNPAKALEIAKQAWSISQDSDLAVNLGPIGYMAGDLRWAYGVLLEAQRSQSATPEAAYYFGLAAYSLARIQQAADTLSRVQSMASLPQDIALLAKAAATLVRFHAGAAPVAEADAALTTAAGIDPEFPPALIVGGMLAEQKLDYQTARAKYEQAIKANPSSLVAQRQLALLLANKLADDNRASQLATSLRTELPEDAEIAAALGKIAYRRGDYRDAVRLLQPAASRLANDADAFYHLGMAQYHLKDTSAKSSLTKAVALNPNAKLAPEANKALASLK